MKPKKGLGLFEAAVFLLLAGAGQMHGARLESRSFHSLRRKGRPCLKH
jgi:hypothetical protein